jgi:polyphosphate kinase
MPDANPLIAPELYINRELSWLAFNRRVLSEATRPDNPVFERMKFLSIVSTNLDEFFMIRVASVRDQVRAGWKHPDPAGLKPKEQLRQIALHVRLMVQEQYQIYKHELLPDLHNAGLSPLSWKQLTASQTEWVETYFRNEVFPALTPMAVEGSEKFPLLSSRSLNLGVLMESRSGKRTEFATVQAPSILPRAVILPGDGEGTSFLLMEEIIKCFLPLLFPGRNVIACHSYRITRNADLEFDEEEASDLLAAIEKSLKKRKSGAVIRLEIEPGMDEGMLALLQDAFQVEEQEIFRIPGPINFDFLLKQLYGLPGFESSKYPSFEPRTPKELPEGGSIFDAIRRRDIFLYHPYDSFDPVLRFVEEAAQDPNVLAIKQTLYRVSGHSPIVAALARAALAGKQVTALLEVKARFDEENNIQWGKHLEKAGCHVSYGLPKLKTHSKILLVVRREKDGLRRYVHLGTGNYNDVTARLYTDMGIFTADSDLGEDAGRFFNLVTGYSETPPMHALSYAPSMLRPEFLRLIHRERDNAKRGLPASIDAKMNSLVDPVIIAALYEASCEGVAIDLTVRGICCLRPKVDRVSENITVRSIVGRFLEHARIFRFENGGDPELFLSSADWMPRNLDRRIELMFPVRDELIQKKVLNVMALQKLDTAKAWRMRPDGIYERILPGDGEEPFNSQEALISGMEAEAETEEEATSFFPPHT